MADGDEGATDADLPADVIETAERLTRRARRHTGERAATHRERRDDLLDRYGYEARVREESDGDVLVCYPAEWLADGEVVLAAIEDRSRAVERPLKGSDGAWEQIERANSAVVECVRDDHGPVHAANVRAFADFMSNHHATRIADATDSHVAEFRAEYYPRNAWPTDEQRARLTQSLRLAFACVGVDRPPL